MCIKKFMVSLFLIAKKIKQIILYPWNKTLHICNIKEKKRKKGAPKEKNMDIQKVLNA